MTEPTILIDAADKPQVFAWNGPVGKERLADWEARSEFNVPDDLSDFWAKTGGGVAFETEDLLCPLNGITDSKHFLEVNEFYWARGLDPGVVVFHTGLFLSVVNSGDYAVLDPESMKTIGKYSSLNDWYAGTIRNEYASRYGLPRAAGG